MNFCVMTPSRGDRNAGDQQFLERPAMVSQPQSHRRRAVMIATHPISNRQAQGPLGSMTPIAHHMRLLTVGIRTQGQTALLLLLWLVHASTPTLYSITPF